MSKSLSTCSHCRALHIAVVQGEMPIVYRLIELLLWARRGFDIYNNLRQVKPMPKLWYILKYLFYVIVHTQSFYTLYFLRKGSDLIAIE